MSSSYPRSTYLTASGFGSSVDRAKSDAMKNLSGIIRSKVKSQSVSIRTESDTTQHFLRREHLDVSTDAVLKGVYFPKVQFDSHQNGYYALAVLNRKKATQALSSELSSLRLRILSKKTQLEGVSDPVHQARLLVRIIEIEKKAIKKSQELSGLSGMHPILGFSIGDDSEKLMNLFSKYLTFAVHITGGYLRVFSGDRPDHPAFGGRRLSSIDGDSFDSHPGRCSHRPGSGSSRFTLYFYRLQ